MRNANGNEFPLTCKTISLWAPKEVAATITKLYVCVNTHTIKILKIEKRENRRDIKRWTLQVIVLICCDSQYWCFRDNRGVGFFHENDFFSSSSLCAMQWNSHCLHSACTFYSSIPMCIQNEANLQIDKYLNENYQTGLC